MFFNEFYFQINLQFTLKIAELNFLYPSVAYYLTVYTFVFSCDGF